MVFHPLEVTIPHIIYVCLGGFIVLFGMFSLLLRERLYIGEALLAFLFGVIIGPFCANIFDPHSWGGGNPDVSNIITLEFTRIVLVIGVFAIGVELPKKYMARHWKSLFFLLVPVMTWGWFVCAGLIYAFVPGLNFLSSLAVAACLTPTDPILAAAVVGGKWADKHVPAHIRHLLASESGCNDGAAYPFLFIALYLILDKSTGSAVRDWFLLLWLYQIIMAIFIGGFLGYAFRHLIKFCERHDLIDRHSYVAQYISLAILTSGICALLGTDDLLAAFTCGAAFAWDGFFNKQTEEAVFSSVIDLLFNIAAFIFVGAWMPFDKFQDAALTLSVWRLMVIAVLVFLLRRLPILVALYKLIPDIKTFRESLFVGHFGPIGIGAVYASTLAAEILRTGHDGQGIRPDAQTELLQQTIQPIVAFLVLCSITIHGLSIPSFSLGRRVHSVSLTWSRRDTTEAPPDWTNQTRRVLCPEDIVINRDNADIMEKGEAGPSNDDLHEQEEDIGLHGRGSAAGRRGRQDTDEGSAETKVESGRPEDYPEEGVPDGDEVRTEWIEPHHRIIERGEGSANGTDVDVEVVDESHDEAGTSTSNLITRHRPWQGRKNEEQKKLQKSALDLQGKEKNPWNKRKASTSRWKDKRPVPSTSRVAANEDDEDEDQWASDMSDADRPSNGPSSSHDSYRMNKAEGKKRSRGFGRKGRRVSLRRSNTSGHANRRAHENEDRSEIRGRSGPVGTTSSRASVPHPGIGSRNHSLVNQRLQSIRVEASRLPTRESSPARSVRFADDLEENGNTSTRGSRILNDVAPISASSTGPRGVEKTDSGSSNGSRVT